MEFSRKLKKGELRKKDSPFLKFLKILAIVILAVGVVLLVAYSIMWLWNWLMPEIFSLPTIGFWQALGVFVLAKIIFGFGGGGQKNKGGDRHKKRFRSSYGPGCSMGNGFDKWKHYDQFWKEEGEAAFESYLEKLKNEKHEND
jgi:uncharacterized membrane protein (DUF485 family)